MDQELSPAHQARLDGALSKIGGVSDKLGLGIDDGIKTAVAMLNHHGLNTTMSCEGHEGWATGGPYIDIGAVGFYEKNDKYQEAMRKNPSNEVREALHIAFAKENMAECKKVLPILDAFYKDRLTPFDVRIGAIGWGHGQVRLESVGVEFLRHETDPEIKNKNLKLFQAEMRDFSDFLVKYEPPVALKKTEDKREAPVVLKKVDENIPPRTTQVGQMLWNVLKNPFAVSKSMDRSNRP